MPTVGVILSGCGVFDGSEIHEAVCSLLALDRAGASYRCMAPFRPQLHVIDHRSNTPMPGSRNVLVESARIARGPVTPLSDAQIEDVDALFMPGGFGAAKNLSTFAEEGPDCSVDEDLERLLRGAHAARKPIGAICIAPAVVARVLGADITVTVGEDGDVASAIRKCGAHHQSAAVSEVVVDRDNLVVTAPCYMYDAPLREVATGAENAIAALLALIEEQGTSSIRRATAL